MSWVGGEGWGCFSVLCVRQVSCNTGPHWTLDLSLFVFPLVCELLMGRVPHTPGTLKILSKYLLSKHSSSGC